MMREKLVVRPTTVLVRSIALCPFTEIGGRVQQQRLTREKEETDGDRKKEAGSVSGRNLDAWGGDEARARPHARPHASA